MSPVWNSILITIAIWLSFVDAADYTLDCDEELTGTIDYGETLTFNFSIEDQKTVTFTDCDSTFDPTLYLINSEGSYIQSQSSNYCDGDDCWGSICSASYRETFTMVDLAAGWYILSLRPYSSGGVCDHEISLLNSPGPPPPLTLHFAFGVGLHFSSHLTCCVCPCYALSDLFSEDSL